MSIVLLRYNEQAYHRVMELLNDVGRACVIHPTGTGKSFIAFRLIELHPRWNVLWLAPSEYIFRTQLQNVLEQSPELQLGCVRFMTYARLWRLQPEELDELLPDCIILDEFHRAGAEQWSKGVMELMSIYPKTKVLGLTATNIRYLDNGRDMAEELFRPGGRNCIASEMTLGEAIVRGILPVPNYVTTVYRCQSELQSYEEKIRTSVPKEFQGQSQRYLSALRRALHRAGGLEQLFARYLTEKHGKYIVFCSDWEHLNQLRRHTKEWFSDVDPEAHCYALYSGATETDAEYDAFLADTSDHLRLLFCINRLNEGVHIDCISGVILFRPTASPIVYKQQIGRALTAGKQSVPLIVDVVNNFESLFSIGTIRSEMAEAVRKLREAGQSEEIVVEHFEVFEQIENGIELFRKLENSLKNTWDSWYAEACVYYAEHGNLYVPTKYVTETGVQLGRWLETQRAIRSGRSKGCISEEHIVLLDQIGMVWDKLSDASWENGYARASEYFQTQGNLLVTSGYVTEDGFALGTWLKYQRVKWRKGELNPERLQRLELIGMVWDASVVQWEEQYQKAKRYYQEHGALTYSNSFKTEDGFLLGRWLARQKKARKEQRNYEKLALWQIKKLDEIGMIWDDVDDWKWQRGYQQAIDYYTQKGDLDIPYTYCTVDGFKLGEWLRRQQIAKQKGRCGNCVITPERIQKLEQLGIVWDIKDRRYKGQA